MREKFTCRGCEALTQPPAPFQPTPRGWAGPNLLASIRFEKFGQHQPLNRQVKRFAREGMEVSLSTAADQVGAAAATLRPLHDLLEAHVFAAERLHGDDTTVQVLSKGKTITGRSGSTCGTTRRSAARRRQRPSSATRGPNSYSSDGTPRRLQQTFRGRPTTRADHGAFCHAHPRRKFFVLADAAANARRGLSAPPISPLALEREIKGRPAAERLAFRREHMAPVVADLEARMRRERAAMSKHAPSSRRWVTCSPALEGFVRFLEDGRICVSNDAAERALRGVALGRKAWLFAGSDRGGECAALMYGHIVTAKMNDVDPQAWLADVLARINDLPQTRLHELLPWICKALRTHTAAE